VRKASSFGCFTFTIISEYSNAVGDIVLEEVSKAINRTIRNSDFTARYGREEFAIVLPETDLKGAVIAAERMRKAIEQLEIDSKG
jgi:diguanylate cyclase (GGDEF)-like protein